MLILTRKEGQRIIVGNAVVEVMRIRGSAVSIGIKAPADVKIRREETATDDDMEHTEH